MKYLKLIYLILFLGIVSCSQEEEPEIPDWDCMHYKLFIDIQDTDGNNLFSDDYHGIVSLDSITPGITFTYNGVTKPVSHVTYTDYLNYLKNFFGTPVCRAIPSAFMGVYVHEWYFADNHPQICFGEFEGTEDHEESVILNWPDGTHSKIDLTATAVRFNGPYHRMKTRIDDREWVETQGGSTHVTFVK